MDKDAKDYEAGVVLTHAEYVQPLEFVLRRQLGANGWKLVEEFFTIRTGGLVHYDFSNRRMKVYFNDRR